MVTHQLKPALVAVTLLALVMVLFASVPSVQASLPGGSDSIDDAAALPLDHFWCYHTASTAVKEAVQLKDQFHTALIQVQVGKPKIFCNPARKKHGDNTFRIKNPDAHLLMYQIGVAAAQTLTIQVKNQFGEKRLKVYEPATYLAVPTKKDQHNAPQNLDHFQCYQVKGAAINETVGLQDQFNKNAAIIVGRPVLLCNPTLKVHGNNQFPPEHPEAHLVCYKVTPLDFSRPIDTVNQFRAEQLKITNPFMLCAPSRKKVVTN